MTGCSVALPAAGVGGVGVAGGAGGTGGVFPPIGRVRGLLCKMWCFR